MSDKPEEPSTGRLTALDDERPTARARENKTYSSIVSRLRFLLPIFVLFIIAALMIWPKIEEELSSLRFEAPPIDKAAIEKAIKENKLLNADFNSIDSKGRPFSLKSDTAIQQNDNPDNIVMENPNGFIQLDDEANVRVTALKGLYKQNKKHLDLAKNVVITRSDGTVLKTETLFVDLGLNNAHTDDPVDIDGPRGHIIATGMDISGGGALTIFDGPIKLTINNNSGEDS